MHNRLRSAWRVLNASYWFLPAVLGLTALLLSVVTLAVDRRLPNEWLANLDLDVLPAIQSEGARAVLTTVASSMITVAGVVFSLTLLVLTQASSQFGPRLLVNFMRDRTNQFVLGIFVATFAYALLVLRVVTAGDGAAGVAAFVPHVSVLTAMALTFFTVGVLVFFFHHVAESVRVTHVLGDLDRALQRMLEALPEGDDDEGDVEADAVPTDFRDDLGVIHARHGGYLQSVEVDALVAAAVERDALLRVLPIVGTFVTRGTPLAEVHPATATDAIADAVLGSVALATDRNPAQDLGFVFDEFLEIALRALSPSMNDPFTAQSCIDHLAQGLLLLDRRRLRRQVHLDADGRVRALVPLQGKGALARHTLGELRRASGGQLLVTRHLLTALLMLRREARGAALRAAVDDELRAVVAGAEGRVPPGDHARLRAMVAHLDPP